MGAVAPGVGGKGIWMDPDEVRRAAQELMRLGDQLIPKMSTGETESGPEQSVAAVNKVSDGGDHVAKECGTLLRQAGEYLEKVVHAFVSVDESNAAAIAAVDPLKK